MTPRTIQLILTPKPGRWLRNRAKSLSRAFAARGAHVLVTEGPEVTEGTDVICSVGGDGTLRHVVEAVRKAGRPIPICAYPGGTINLLATECGYPSDVADFARHALETPTPRPHYVADAGGVPLLVCASVGPDSYAVERLSPALKRTIGRCAYVVAFLHVLIHWPRPKITVLHDGGRTDCEAVYIAKGRFFAGRWSFAPQASVLDPLLHVVVLERATRRIFVRFVWQLMRHRPIGQLDGVRRFTSTSLTITSNSAAPLQGDGDVIAYLPVTIAEAEAVPFITA